jgi:pyrroloquinoline quinone biosynthesis protein B
LSTELTKTDHFTKPLRGGYTIAASDIFQNRNCQKMLVFKMHFHQQLLIAGLSLMFLACNSHIKPTPIIENPFLIILGTVQDGGSPHIGCTKDCCQALFEQPSPSRKVVSLGIVDPVNQQKFLFEATPDLTAQVKDLKKYAAFNNKETPDGIFLTHAHIGHYAGLMYLGREALGAKSTTVYAMPRMKLFLENNGPWSQLVALKNIDLQPLADLSPVVLNSNIKVTPFRVPHRDEFSETVGYKMEGPNKKVLFVPDIDKWEKWETSIITEIAKVDYALIDGTFYDETEIENRKISEIPHPFIIESMEKFKNLPAREKNKIWFIHFNHTNPVLNPESPQSKNVAKNGFHVARFHQILSL